MTDMIVVYIPCANKEEATIIGDVVMKRRFAPCYNILPMSSAALWPPKTGDVERIEGVVLLLKSIDKNYHAIEDEVKKRHSDKNPCIFSIPVSHVSKEYYEWFVGEME